MKIGFALFIVGLLALAFSDALSMSDDIVPVPEWHTALQWIGIALAFLGGGLMFIRAVEISGVIWLFKR